MTDYFDDSFWDEPAGSDPTGLTATTQVTRVNRRIPERTRTHHVVARDPSPAMRRHERSDTESDLESDLSYEMWLEPAGRGSGRDSGRVGTIDPRLLSVGALA